MANNVQATPRNFLEEYITLAKERCDKARHKQYCRLSMEYFENMAVVMIMIADRVQIACFIEEDLNSYWPVFTYWLTKEQRVPIVARMYKQGISGIRIARFLKVASSTVYKDLQYLREAQSYKIENRLTLTNGTLRESRIINDGDFKIAALNFQSHVQDLNNAFMQAHGQTLQ